MSPPHPETGLCTNIVCHAANGTLHVLRKYLDCLRLCRSRVVHLRELMSLRWMWEKVWDFCVLLRMRLMKLSRTRTSPLPTGRAAYKAFELRQLTQEKTLELGLAQPRVVELGLPLRKAFELRQLTQEKTLELAQLQRDYVQA
ncbi:hypothetical protein PRIC2_014469 [Phytophthora ramorum]